MKTIKYLVVLVCMTLGLANIAKAQIYSSEDCFYAKEGYSDVKYVVKFQGNRAWLKSVSHSTVRSNLAKSKNFYENEKWTDGQNSVHMYEYDSGRSTSAREVYKYTHSYTRYWNPWTGWEYSYRPGVGYTRSEIVFEHNYVAFSKDKSTFIKWWEPGDNYNGEIRGRDDYSRVSKENLLPKAVNDDFLY